MGLGGELDAARLQLWEDRAAEARRQRRAVLVYLVLSMGVAIVLAVFFLQNSGIPASLAVVALAWAAADLVALGLAWRGHLYVAGVMSQLVPILPVVYFASALSADAGFGSYLFIGALGVMVTIPEGHNRTRYTAFALLVIAVAVTQIFFHHGNAWSLVSTDLTTAINTFNRTVMSIALFALALQLVRTNRISQLLVSESLRIADLVATVDPLTGVANRRPVWNRLETATLEGQHVTVGLADMDNFKLLNDRYGHDCGDDALRYAARVLTEAVRDEDLVARWGGEEFVILVNLPQDRALAIFERARAHIASRPVPCSSGEPHHVTISIGVAALQNADPAAAISAADAALYRAKQAGRDRVVA